jgi:DNA anti-recombination protein RmuC
MDVEALILKEIEKLNEKQDQHNMKLDKLTDDVHQRLVKLETQTKPLFDNGQPGRCTRMEEWGKELQEKMDKRVTKLEHWRFWVVGYTTCAAVVVSIVVAAIVRWLGLGS